MITGFSFGISRQFSVPLKNITSLWGGGDDYDIVRNIRTSQPIQPISQLFNLKIIEFVFKMNNINNTN